MDFLVITCYTLFAYGVTNMMVYAEGPWNVFSRMRTKFNELSEGLGKLVTCMMCLSTWVGVFVSVLDAFVTNAAFTPFNIIIHNDSLVWLKVILDAGFTSGAVWILHNFEEACERHGAISYEERDEDGSNG